MSDYIEEGLYTFLSSMTPNGAGDRYYPSKAPQKVSKPYVVFEKISGERVQNITGPSGQARPRIRIHVYGDTYSSVKILCNQIRRRMNGFSGLMGTIQVKACSIITETDLYEDETNTFHNVLDFLVSHVET